MKIKDRILELTRVKVSQLTPHPQNWRKHPKIQKDAIRGALAEIGYADALKVRKHNGGYQILDGHLRAEATPDTKVPVLVLDLDEDESKKMLATFDPLGSMAVADKGALRDLIGEIEIPESLAVSLDGFLEEAIAEEGQDEIPDVRDEAITGKGDLWTLGPHRVLCGDSSNAGEVARLMDGEKIDLCFTSPPYNNKDGGYQAGTKRGCETKLYIQDTDSRTEDEWVEFCDSVLKIIETHLRSEESTVVWNVMYTAQCRSGYGTVMFAGSHGLKVKETICWDKGNGYPINCSGILSRNWELIFVLSCGQTYATTQKKNECRWAKWDIARPAKQNELLKATFPVGLPARAIEDFGGDVVFDPFMGTGTTLVAAEQRGRSCYGMELEPVYCDVVVKRWEKLTGKTATRQRATE